jgi:hypothetical protein
MLHSLIVLTFISRSVWLFLFAYPTLLVVDPLPFIHSSIWLRQLSKPVALILVPASLINLAISMQKLSMSNNYRINPCSFKHRFVREFLPSFSMHLPSRDLPLPSILRPITQLYFRPTLYINESRAIACIMLLYRPH